LNSLVIVLVGFSILPFIFLYAQQLFPFFLLAQFFSLPLLLILRTNDIGLFSVGFQFLSLLTAMILFLKVRRVKFHTPSIVALSLLSLLCVFGFFMPQTNATPIIVKIIASKSLLLPVILSLLVSGIIDRAYAAKIVKMMFYVCIGNSIAGVVQLQLGTAKLIALGLPYGTQIREFRTGRVRALGLSLTNFEFALFSGLTALVCYAVISKLILIGDVSRLLALFTLLASTVSMYTSITRQGILFPLIGIAFMEVTRARNAIRLYTIIYFAFIASTLLVVANNLFVRSDSFFGRISLWKALLDEYGQFLGNGIAFCGGATTSSFARNISQIFVDNFFISVFLQFGFLGLIIYIIALLGFMHKTNRLGTAIVVAIALTSLITEFWDYTSVAALALILIATVGQNTEMTQTNETRRAPLVYPTRR
jgi:hypothetical protein